MIKKMWAVDLPWPTKNLSPNARVHWASKAKAVKQYRLDCFWLCRDAGMKKLITAAQMHLYLEFFPPDRRKRDDDNIIASFKAGRDGIADALCVNDDRFVLHYLFVPNNIVKGGLVKVVMRELDA